jgi:hypothetical protein
MSQVDKLNYLPMILWFVIFLVVFYFMIFSFILPLIFSSLSVRFLFFDNLLKNLMFSLKHYYVYFFSIFKPVFIKFLLNFVKKGFVLKFSLLKNKSF